MQFFVGTSGYSYPKWRGSFYPAKMKPVAMLSYYAEHFAACELNDTFRRLPTVEVVAERARHVPARFRFAVKAPPTITHRKRLRDVAEDAEQFLTVAKALGRKLGPLLFQLPPNMKQDLARLDALLKAIDRRANVAVEFRHPSWFADDTYALLKKHRAALCAADAEELPEAPLIDAAKWGYVRMRRENYTDRQLRAWITKLRARPWAKCYVFFKHEDTGTGPHFAARFLDLAAE